MEQQDGLLYLQDFIRMRPTLLVGSGLSRSMGLPGMGELLAHLAATVPMRCAGQELLQSEWAECMDQIKRHGFEEGLSQKITSAALIEIVVQETAELIGREDALLCMRLFGPERLEFPFAALLKHLVDSLPPTAPVLDVITPNYDHLVEYACDLVGIRCVTGFRGALVPTFKASELGLDLYSPSYTSDRRGRRIVEPKKVPRVILLKPHGSLQWQCRPYGVIQYPVNLDGSTRVMITPGATKYELSLTDPVMNAHREAANSSLRRSSAVLVIGYGFNDRHLQTVLRERLQEGLKCVVVTYGIRDEVLADFRRFPNVLALEHAEPNGTIWHQQEASGNWQEPLWDLKHFVRMVI